MKFLTLLLAALLLAFSAPRSAPELYAGSRPVAAVSPTGIQGRTGAPLRVSGEPAGWVDLRSEDGPTGAARDAAMAEPGTASPAEFDLATGSGQIGGAPLFARTGIGTAAGTIRGVASYYGTGPAGVAAAGPNLRAAFGRNWRGTWVRVSYRGRSAWLRLGDACWCQVADIDIPTRTFSYLSRGELWRGLLRVTITWGDVPRLPATSTEEGWKP